MSLSLLKPQASKRRKFDFDPDVLRALVQGNEVLHDLSEIKERLAQLEKKAAELARSLQSPEPGETSHVSCITG